MAEGTTRDNSLESEKMEELELECGICLRDCLHPFELPCGHIFCFLCAKGVAIQSKKCGMCRHPIPSDYFDHPYVVKSNAARDRVQPCDNQYQWFYSGGGGGWWQYDARTNLCLSEAYVTGKDVCELMICGYCYIIDFIEMVQYRKDNPELMRYIRYDSSGTCNKGIAGLRILD